MATFSATSPEFPHVYDSGVVVNPGANAILVDTVADIDVTKQYKAFVTLSCTVATQFQVQHRNAANGANLDAVTVNLNGALQLFLPFQVAAGERLRVQVLAAITGNASAAMNIMQLASGFGSGYI
jgi:hypothetical protein